MSEIFYITESGTPFHEYGLEFLTIFTYNSVDYELDAE